MKKLVIAAAAAAMIGGVYADELCEESVGGSGCSVYNVKFTFKTLVGKKFNCAKYLAEGDFDPATGTGGGTVPMGVWTRYVNAAAYPSYAMATAGKLVAQTYYDKWVEGGEAPTTANNSAAWYGDLYWADNATRTLEGILWQCEANCFEGFEPHNGKGSGTIYFALWEKKTERVLSYPVFKYYKNATHDTFNWLTPDETGAFSWMGRYGAKAEKIGVAWAPTTKGWTWDWIDAVGFGTFDVKALHMKSVTGGAVAGLESYVNGKEDDCGNGTFKLQVAYVCEEFKAWCCDPCFAAVDWVPAYGNWSLKYNASLSKGKTPLSKILPKYAIFSETGDDTFTNGFDNKGIFEEIKGPNKVYADQKAIVTAATAWVDTNEL